MYDVEPIPDEYSASRTETKRLLLGGAVRLFVFNGLIIAAVLAWFVGRPVFSVVNQVQQDEQRQIDKREAEKVNRLIEEECRRTGLSREEAIREMIRKKIEEPDEGKTEFEKYVQKTCRELLEKHDK